MSSAGETRGDPGTGEHLSGGTLVVAVVAWLWVLIPFAYGLYELIIKIPALFAG